MTSTTLGIAVTFLVLASEPPCEFVTDRDSRETPDTPRPAYLAPFVDPVFQTRGMRVSDPGQAIPNVGGTWDDVARHHYSLDQAWNADLSLLMLDRGTEGRGRLFLDGSTYEPLFLRKGPSWRDRWHPTQSDLRIYVKDNELGTWNVRTGQVTVIATVNGYSNFQFGPYEGNPSRDGNRLAVLADDPQGRQVAFAYDLAERKKFADIDLESVRIDWVSISALGNYVVVHYDGDTTRIFDLDAQQVGPYWSAYGRPSHFDLTVDDNGDEVAVGVSKSSPDDGRVIKRRLSDGAVTQLTTAGYATHTSARNIRQPGWVFVSYNHNTRWPPYVGEVVAVKLDGSGTVRRLAHHHRGADGYLDETHASPSPDGSKVIWASNWDDPGGLIAAYVTEVCVEDEPPPVEDEPLPPAPEADPVPEAPRGLAAEVLAEGVRLTWEPSTTNTDGSLLTDLAAYEVWDGAVSGAYTTFTEVGPQPGVTVAGWPPGRYHVAVAARSSIGARSAFSNEVIVDIDLASDDPHSAGENLVGNASFETDTSGWTASKVAELRRFAGGVDGDYALEVRATRSRRVFGISDDPGWVAVTGKSGTRYRLSAWIRSASSNGFVRLRIAERLANDTESRTESIRLSSKWQELTLEHVVQNAGTPLDVTVECAPFLLRTSFEVDAISLERVE